MSKAQTIQRYSSVSHLVLANLPALNEVITDQLIVWPEHEATIATSLGNHSEEMLKHLEQQASMVLKLATLHFGGIRKVCEGYRYFCENMILESELFFRRHGKYERSSLEEAIRDVYMKPEIMENYMNGLLLAGIFWHNHACAHHFYKSKFLPMLPCNFSHLEVGPGHGALLYLTAQYGNVGEIEAWDISPSSINATRRTLETLNIADEVTLVCQDVMKATGKSEHFDSIVVSEVLEHLEDPLRALEALRPTLKTGGHILVNMPANSPAPDHLYLINKPEEVSDLMEEAGYKLVASAYFPMTGYSLEKCLQNRLTVTCVVVGQKLF